MSGLAIRPARREDLQTIVAMLDDDEHSSGREDPSLPLDPRYAQAFDAIDADPDQLLVIAEIEGQPVGTLQLSFLPGIAFRGAWRGHVEAVRVASDRRGEGVGAQLMTWAEAQCRARGCRLAQLMSNESRTDAHRFYERLGWAKSHRGFKKSLESA
ncbi:GNAT family N-acetyltransferase [Parasphingopyxis marina]|uniref:GNAT family N-acetyltransferase n=1 Tax=Parasphingopyxis marina TaxID=2761622 RepID=A0A842HYG4_9SPHN|nr:GNAT family N-acetyltransferase [Parasphingopyxis marina]MBC2777379.1 GNAT family N-acetyltransferase [Parasphingopyxis marina]